jgi:hypothetical protein
MLTLQRGVNRIQYMVWPRASRCGSRADESSHVGTGLSLFAAILITACLAWPPRPAYMDQQLPVQRREICAQSRNVYCIIKARYHAKMSCKICGPAQRIPYLYYLCSSTNPFNPNVERPQRTSDA